MLAAVPTWITDWAIIVGALTTFFAFVGIILKSPVGRWFKRQIAEDVEAFVGDISEKVATRALVKHREQREQEIVEVLDQHLPRHLEPVLYELRTNGGGSFRDDVTAKLDQVAHFMEESESDREDLRRLFEAEIARTRAAQRGEIDDRTEGP